MGLIGSDSLLVFRRVGVREKHRGAEEARVEVVRPVAERRRREKDMLDERKEGEERVWLIFNDHELSLRLHHLETR
jgi:hypothetical protein